MKHEDRMKRKIKPSSSSAQSMAASGSRGVATKTKKMNSISPLRLAMQKPGTDSSSTEKANPRTKSAKRKRVDQSAMIQAEELQSKLSVKHPSFIKPILPSHVFSCFWLGLPAKFCNRHLPITDTVIELIDENGIVFNARYLAAKAGLSGGWRGFSVAQKLQEGDVLVFHLLQSAIFKVYIIRHSIDGALGLPDSDTQARVMVSNDICSGSLSGESHGSEVLDWIQLSESESASLECFDKFSILLDGSRSIDAKIPDHIRRKYYIVFGKYNI